MMWNTHAVEGDDEVVSATLAEMSEIVGVEGWRWHDLAPSAATAGDTSSSSSSSSSSLSASSVLPAPPAVVSGEVHNWNDGFMLTAASTGSSGRCVYRFSPDLTAIPSGHAHSLSMSLRYLSNVTEGDGTVTTTIRVNTTVVKLRNASVRLPEANAPPASKDGLWIVQYGPPQQACAAERTVLG